MTARRTAAALAVVLTVPLLVLAPGGQAADPESSSLVVPTTPGETVTSTYTGTISPGANPNSSCGLPTSPADEHVLDLVVAPGTYDSVSAVITFTIEWEASENDEILSVLGPDGEELGSSDGGSPQETVALDDLEAGAYTAAACAFASPTAQDYTGTITVTTTAPGGGGPGGEGVPPLGPDNGLSFSATVPSDPQRDESEPLIETDVDGRMYTCGPTGTSGQAEYAQVSEDGGDQFHLLGQSPRGQLAAGGGGDCALAVGAAKEQGAANAPFAFTGLNALVTFSSATSPDGGKTLTTSPNNVSIPGVDRQWMTFVDATTVLLSYNRLAPRAVVVQRSTDGGLTYAPPVPVSPNPTFPGPIRSYYGTPAATEGREGVAYYTWTAGTVINLAVSMDKGLTWNNCQIHDAGVGADAGFTSSDHDDAGNLFVSYAEEGLGRDNYLTVLSADKLDACVSGPAGEVGPDPGFDEPVRVNRGAVDTVVFPWVAAGGDVGRVAVAYYGTETDGDPNTGEFKATWDVYVSQSLDFTPGGPKTFGQVKATTHPFHYDSICLNGLGCALPPAGDRSLADFFAIEYNRADGRLALVYNQGSKKPDEVEGHVATPAVVVQESGPSNGGGTVQARRPVLRTSSTDPTEDALAPYSQLVVPPPTANRPALDLTGVEILPEQDLESGAPVADGGFTVRMKVASLADGDLQSALAGTQTNSLVYLFRFVNGFQASGATARYSPTSGFSFAYDDYTTEAVGCGSTGEKCIVYPGGTELQGKVDQETGEITMNVPRDLLRQLTGPTGPGERPTEAPAVVGSRFYDGTAFALANPALNPLDPGVVTFALPVDNAPAMDFLLPAAAPGTTPPGTTPPGAGPGAGPSTGNPPSAAAPGGAGRGTGARLAATGGLGAPLAALTLVTAGVVLALGRRKSSG